MTTRVFDRAATGDGATVARDRRARGAGGRARDRGGARVRRAAAGASSASEAGRGRRRGHRRGERGREDRGAARRARMLARGERWVAVDKPAGVPTIPDQGGASHALLALAARALGLEPSRASRDVAPRSRRERRRRLRARRARRPQSSGICATSTRYDRRYVALAARAPPLAEGTWSVPIGRAKDPRHRAANGRDAVHARNPLRRRRARRRDRSPSSRSRRSPAGPTSSASTRATPARRSSATAPTAARRAYARERPRLRVRSHRAPRRPRHAWNGRGIDSPVPPKLREAWLALGGDGAAWEKALSWPLAEKK